MTFTIDQVLPSVKAAMIVERHPYARGFEIEDLADSYGVSRRLVDRAKRVRLSDRHLFDKIKAGKLHVNAAERAMRKAAA